MKLLPLSACLLLSTVVGSAAAGAPKEVAVLGTRVHLADIVPGLEARAAAVDLGPTPAAGASRLVTRDDVLAACDHELVRAPTSLPPAIRIVRRTRHLEPWDVDALVRTAMAPKPLHHGVVLAMVRTPRAIDVVDGYARADVDVPVVPKKAGAFATTTTLTFTDAGGEVLARLPVPVVFAVSEEGATYDTPRGSAVTVVVRRGLVEVRVPGVATLDGDVGDAIPVQVRASGHVMRARLLARDEALVVEAAR